MITKSKMKAIVDAIVSIRDNISDNQALTAVALYPDWKIDVNYTAGTRVVFNGALYKVLQNHISQETWTPIDAPSLFAKVLIPDENVISIWE
jgi:CRISPR/Cas system CSM-associated protein Csm2 small subunit